MIRCNKCNSYLKITATNGLNTLYKCVKCNNKYAWIQVIPQAVLLGQVQDYAKFELPILSAQA